MKLYNCKKGDKVRLYQDALIPPAHRPLLLGEVLSFDHVDGMYSLCKDKEGNIVHPAAWSEVEIVK